MSASTVIKVGSSLEGITLGMRLIRHAIIVQQ